MDIKFSGYAHETAEAHLRLLVGFNVTWRVRARHPEPGYGRERVGQGKLVDVGRSADGWLYIKTQETLDDFENYDGGFVVIEFDDLALRNTFDYGSFSMEVH